MSEPPASGVWILLNSTSGVKKAEAAGKKRGHPTVFKGELLVEIPRKEQVKQEETNPPHNYALLRDPDVTLYDNGTNIAPLPGPEADYLEGVKDPHLRFLEYRREDRLKWIMDTKIGDVVYFKMETDKSTKVQLQLRGRVKWYGAMEGERGVMFGIEITDPEHRGKGSTNGYPYFKCNHRDGVFVSMEKIIKQKEGSVPNREDDHATPINKQPVASKHPVGGPPAHNTRSRMPVDEGKKEGFLNKVENVVDKAFSYLGGGQLDTSVDHHANSARSVVLPSQDKFSPGDSVVVQTANGKSVTGTVRWVGPIRAAGRVIIPAVGIETDKFVFPDKDFPDVHLDITGSHGQHRFKIDSGHSRLYLPEAMVLLAAEYAKQKQEDNTFEAQEAKKWGLSVDEYREQMGMMRKAQDGKQREFDARANKHTEQQNEEGRSTGTGDLNDPLPLLGPEQSVSKAFSKERIEQEKEALEEINREKGLKRQHSQEHYQHPTDQQPPAADRSREEERHSLPSPNMEKRYVHRDDPSHSPYQHHNEDHNHPNQYHPADNRHHPGVHQPQEHSFHPSGDDPTLPAVLSDPSHFTHGTLVQIESHEGKPRYGTIRWIGTLPDFEGMYAGVELDYSMERCSDGSFDGVRYFSCPPGRGFFCLLAALQLDQRYLEPNQIPAAKRQDYKNPLADKVPLTDDDDTPGDPGLFSKYIGDEHGIQGHHNSCYLDATVFGLFALSESFDMMLLEEPETKIGQKIKHILWKGIVNPLRKYGVARYESIMMLRNELENLGRMKGANKDEKDPEEFLNMLFKEILHVDPFISIKRPFGVEKEFFVQLFFEIDPNQITLPATEQLIKKMFIEQQISFTCFPSKLLLQMPRFGKEFKMYSKIIPSLELDVNPLLDPASRGVQKCHLCLNLTGTIYCSSCANEVFHTEESPVFLCDGCSDTVHERRGHHKFEEVRIKRLMGDASRFSKMTLLSVVCIETSHYVCFTRTNDRWLFHDSMANRLYDMYNIPRVTDVSNELNHWVYNPDNHQKLMQTPSREVPEYVRRFTQDIYMCVYINPDLDRYGVPHDNDCVQSPASSVNSSSRVNERDPIKPVPVPRVSRATDV